MAPEPQCTALASAMHKSGERTALAWHVLRSIAAKINRTEQHVIDVCTGAVRPTMDEFNAIAMALEFQESPPHTGVHACD
ncbi:hypothetical protein BD626DRAFT_509380 [Schizophyllum amplum]|uniref:Uncharacterized protein n=1 Tax=Schizophyllum amplum TaxID=97359 RepID=A0A550C2K0_9AGAR|nr:hypothetical protein BD626DRAFT_509380 [Auriculariopsis ampla]